MSSIDRNSVEESKRDGMKPEDCQNASAPPSIARTRTARPPIASAARDTTFQRVPEKRAADTLAGISGIDGELTEQNAGNRIGQPPGAYLAGQDRRRHCRWGKSVKADHAGVLPDNHHAGEAFGLIGKGVGPEPVVQGRFATIKR